MRERATRTGPAWAAGRTLLLALVAGVPLCLLPACTSGQAATAPGTKVVVLGFDGMDYGLVRQMLAEGRLPNLARLAAQGSFTPLGTAIPPQSPVAWSNFITGMDAGGHGIFDFIARDPKTMLPYLSTSTTEGSERNLTIGKWKIPLSGGKVELLRHGEAFWDVLERAGIRTTIMRMPANFPPSGTASYELSGMGTPDILGTYGTFSFYTTDPQPWAGRSLSGGKVYDVFVLDNVVNAKLYGPDNPFLVKKEKLSLDFTVYIDPTEPVVKIDVGGEERVLKVGEWSDWVPLEFDMIPTQKLRAIARFYLKSVRPDFALYVTPLNFDPKAPGLPISTPADFSEELADATGDFYTQGMPEDTHALRNEVLNRDEFLQQAAIAGDEVIHQYDYVLDHWKGGLLFYYFGNGDQVSHMMWVTMDPTHPGYDEARDAPYKDVIPSLYEKFDAVVGKTLDKVDKDTLVVVMSDHGFTSLKRYMNLNTWLKEEGYLVQIDPTRDDPLGLLGTNIDWSRTRAYALGLNSLYINLQGREKDGIVPPSERQALMDEISGKLLKVIDPATGKPGITKVFETDRAYHDRGYLDIAPDFVIGYAKGTRCSDSSALGKLEPEIFKDNTSEWSGDHEMDPDTVPGILFTSRKLKRPAENLQQLAPAILEEFGIEGFPPRKGGD
ncbi:MAG TPA: alkaline phosphatase family protein [Candidatus Saccharimonadales bacterium]|nr:alkaline phosphatase family protein [Candidatus Saccharimonadales bacterium]